MPRSLPRPERPSFPSLLLPLASAALLALAGGALRAQAPERVVVVGTVYDSLARAPLGGALVQLVEAADVAGGRSYVTIADSAGAFRLDSVAPGRYLIGFFHPRLDSLGLIVGARAIDRPDRRAAARLALAVPSPATVVGQLCPDGARRDSTGLLLGQVRDADSEQPVPGATVWASWFTVAFERGRGLRTDRLVSRVQTDETGHYVVCGVSPDLEVAVQAAVGGDTTQAVTATVPRGGVGVQPLYVGHGELVLLPPDSGATPAGDGVLAVRRGQARLAGTVHDQRGHAVRGAHVVALGTGLEATTDSAGGYVLSQLPSGSQEVEARAVGFAPQRTTIVLSARRPARADFDMREIAVVLREVRVQARRIYSRAVEQFAERRRRGAAGYFLDEGQLAKRNALRLSELLRNVPGVMLMPSRNGPGSIAVFSGTHSVSRACLPVIYFDHVRLRQEDTPLDLLATPEQVVAIEVYPRDAFAPPEFHGDGCGSIVVWTKAY